MRPCMYRPCTFFSMVLVRCVPWMIRPLDDDSVTHIDQDRCFPTLDCIQRRWIITTATVGAMQSACGNPNFAYSNLTHRPRDALSKGRIVQATHCPRDALSKGRIGLRDIWSQKKCTWTVPQNAGTNRHSSRYTVAEVSYSKNVSLSHKKEFRVKGVVNYTLNSSIIA